MLSYCILAFVLESYNIIFTKIQQFWKKALTLKLNPTIRHAIQYTFKVLDSKSRRRRVVQIFNQYPMNLIKEILPLILI